MNTPNKKRVPDFTLQQLEMDIRYAERQAAREAARKEEEKQMKIRYQTDLCRTCRLSRYASVKHPKCPHTSKFIPDYATEVAYDYNNKPYVTACRRYTPHKCDGCDNHLTCAFHKTEGVKKPEDFQFIKGFVRLLSPNNFVAITHCENHKTPGPRKPFRPMFAQSTINSMFEHVIETTNKPNFKKSPTYHPQNED